MRCTPASVDRREPCQRSFRTPLGVGVLRLSGKRLDVDDARPRLQHAREQREVLPEWMALETGRQVDVAQIRAPGEVDSKYLVSPAFVQVGASVGGNPTLSRAV